MNVNIYIDLSIFVLISGPVSCVGGPFGSQIINLANDKSSRISYRAARYYSCVWHKKSWVVIFDNSYHLGLFWQPQESFCKVTTHFWYIFRNLLQNILQTSPIPGILINPFQSYEQNKVNYENKKATTWPVFLPGSKGCFTKILLSKKLTR